MTIKMQVCSTQTLDDMLECIAKRYKTTTRRIQLHPAPGDAGRWFVTHNGLVMTGLHVLQYGPHDYRFETIVNFF